MNLSKRMTLLVIIVGAFFTLFNAWALYNDIVTNGTVVWMIIHALLTAWMAYVTYTNIKTYKEFK